MCSRFCIVIHLLSNTFMQDTNATVCIILFSIRHFKNFAIEEQGETKLPTTAMFYALFL
jgi:hypothetical protein